VKRSFKIIALTVGLVAVIGVILPPWPQNVPWKKPAKSEDTTYRFTLYCSRLYCNDLQDVTAEQLDSISKAISDTGPSGIQVKACEWSAFSCVPAPHEEFRAVIRNLVGTALVMQSGAKMGAGGLTVGAPEAVPEIRKDSTNEARVVVPEGAKTAVGDAIR
jgi:hypothetical protein